MTPTANTAGVARASAVQSVCETWAAWGPSGLRTSATAHEAFHPTESAVTASPACLIIRCARSPYAQDGPTTNHLMSSGDEHDLPDLQRERRACGAGQPMTLPTAPHALAPARALLRAGTLDRDSAHRLVHDFNHASAVQHN